MDSGLSTSAMRHSYGPASFMAALSSILATEFAAWATAVPYVIAAVIYVLPSLLVVDAVVYVLVATRSGKFGQVGRGILIGSLSVPISFVVFTAGFIIAKAIGPI